MRIRTSFQHRFGLNREVAAVFWAMIFHEAAYGAYSIVWPLWIERLGAPVSVVGVVLGCSGLLRLGILAPSAVLLERFGTRGPATAARAAAALGLVSAALATHWPQLFLMVVGVAAGDLVLPLGQAHVAAHAGSQRVRAFTLVYTIGPSVALGVAPLATGAVVALWGMRAAFLFAAACSMLSMGFFANLGRSAAPAGEGAARSSYRAAMGDGRVRRLLALMIGTIFTMSLGTAFVPTFLHDVRGLPAATIATLGAAAAIGSALCGLAVARLAWLQRWPLVGVAIAVTGVALGWAILDRTSAMGLIVLAFICRGGFLAAWSLFASVLGEVASDVHRARAFALGEMLGGAAFALAPMAAGPLYAIHPSLPFAAALALAAIFVPLALRARRVTACPRQPALAAVEPA